LAAPLTHNWQARLLQRIGAPVTQNGVRFLNAWLRAEGGSATNNPFNTTLPYAGAGSYNSVGVRNYPTAQAGLEATAKTLLDPRYRAIVAGLRSGADPRVDARALAASPWGTGDLVLKILGSPPATSGAGPAMPAAASVPPSRPPAAAGPGQSPPRVDPGALRLALVKALGSQNFWQQYASLRAQPPTRPQAPVSAPPAAGGAGTRTVDPHGSLTPPRTALPPATQTGANLVSLASRQLGQPYVWGGESRKEGGFDCSGLVDWAMRQQGYQGPRLTTYSIAKLGASVKGQKLRPGDLILTHNYGHVVIYAGGGKVIAAPHTGTVVQYQPLSQFQIDDVRRV